MKMIDKFRELLDKHGVKGIKLSEETPITLAANAKAADGSEVGTPTEFVVDAELYVLVDGNPQPAPDGEIAMEDGSTIVVAGGKIVEIKAAEAKEEEMSDEVLAVVSQLAERVSALETKNTELSAQLSAAETKATELETKLSDSQKKVTELSAQAAVKSVKDKAPIELKKEAAPLKPKSQMSYAEKVAAKREELAKSN